MDHPSRQTFSRLLAVVFALASFWPGGAAAQSFRVEQRDGLTVVRNGAKPAPAPGGPRSVRLAHELTIGGEDDAEEAMILTLRAVQAGEKGDIFVLDGKSGQVKVYGPDGRHRRTFGRKGQGPGELQSPSRMVLTRDGRLCFLDLGNNRVAFHSPEGECLKEVPLAGWRPFRYLPDSKGFGYGDILDLQGGAKDVLIKLDAKLDKVATVATLVVAENPSEQTMPIEMFRLIYQVDREDRIVWASTGAYELHVVDPGGKPVRRVERASDRISYSGADKDRLIKAFFRGQAPPAGFSPYFPPHKPVLYHFIVDDEGRYYVRTYEQDGQGRFFYDVFDPEGRYFARFSLPEGELLHAVRNGKAYTAVEENEAGVPQVKRYAVVWE